MRTAVFPDWPPGLQSPSPLPTQITPLIFMVLLTTAPERKVLNFALGLEHPVVSVLAGQQWAVGVLSLLQER